jgi:hypothetical protein
MVSPGETRGASGCTRRCASPPTECRLIITRRGESEVLVQWRSGFLRLPAVTVPSRQRLAPHLLPAIRTGIGLDAICCYSLDLEEGPTAPARPYCVLEALSGEDRLKGGWTWIGTGEAAKGRFREERDAQACRGALQRMAACGHHVDSGNFTRAGWFTEVRTWVRSQLSRHGMILGTDWEQYNMGPDFELLRFATDGPAVWFKAVGAPNLRELAITTRLARLDSDHVPTILAHQAAWHAWLMLDAGATCLDQATDPRAWRIVARSLARLQLAALPHVEELSAAGCDDLRPCTLSDQIQPFLSRVEKVIDLQPTCPPRRLSRTDLALAERLLRRSCRALEVLSVPDTLGHSDFNPGNVLIQEERAVFIDWMLGHTGHPFLTFEYLCALLRRIGPTPDKLLPSLREEYLRPWRRLLSAEQIAKSLQFSPLVAVFAYAQACTAKQGDASIEPPESGGFLRALTRRMCEEARRIEEIPCP